MGDRDAWASRLTVGMVHYLILITICIVGAMLQATIGFGFPIFAMIFLVMIFPFSTAVTITQFAGLLGVGYFFFKYRKFVQWRVLLPFLVPALLIGISLTYVSVEFPVSQLKIGLGLVLIGIALLFLFRSGSIGVKPTPQMGFLMGSLSGVMNGLFAVGGPPVALYLLPTTEDKLGYIASANAYFLIFKIFSLPIRFSNGSIQREHIPFLLVSLFSMTIGILIGDRLMRRIPKPLLRIMVYSFVAVSGLIIILQEIF
jgi:uncharacterized membrane protein YfcA